MNNSFDLSPVIDLLTVLSADQSIKGGSSNRNIGKTDRRLGDFTEVWAYLGLSDVQIVSANKLKIDWLARGNLNTPASLKSIQTIFLHPIVNPRSQIVSYGSQVDFSELPNETYPRSDDELSSNRKNRAVISTSVPPPERKFKIIQKLLNMFPDTRKKLLDPSLSPSVGCPSGDVHVFVDNSNILIGFYDHIKKIHNLKRTDHVRRPLLSFQSLTLVMERGRKAAKRVLVGSLPATPEVRQAKQQGYETHLLERVEKDVGHTHTSDSSGWETGNSRLRTRKVEQAVDEVIHLKILESVLDFPPSTIVLASGDGNIGEYSSGFCRVIERCLIHGWTVEIVSFRKNLSGVYRDREFRKKWKSSFRVILLDNFAEDLLL